MTDKSESDEIKDIELQLSLLGISAQAFYSGAGVSSSTWHRIKAAETVPNGATMRRIRKHFEGVMKHHAGNKTDKSDGVQNTERGEKKGKE